MVDLSKLESEQVELKFENEYRRLKKREYARKAAAKKKELKRMLTNANQEQAARKVENKRPRTESSQPLARETAASHRTGSRSIIIQVD